MPRSDPSVLPGSERGTSLVETLVAIACLSVVMSAAMIYIVTSWRFSEFNRDKVFAYEKAVSILTEMQAFLETSDVEAASDLDSFDDGIRVDPSLTITRDALDPTQFVAPNHPASGNIQAVGVWRWTRQITVAPFPGVTTRDLRIVTVRIYRGQDGVDPTQDPLLFPEAKGVKFAEVSSVLRTIADAYPTSQVFDIYLLAIENVPGWWVFMDAIRPFVETTIDDLQSRNPGLRFRTHWITKNGYGRNPWYRPFWNTVQDSKQDVDVVHFYPSMMPPLDPGPDGQFGLPLPTPDDRISSAYYYVPEALRGWARTETGDLNGYDVGLTMLDAFGNTVPNQNFNPFPYTLADQWNHCMRSVDEEAWFRLRRDYGSAIAGSNGSEDDAVPTWHILLDRMKSSPSLYRNAIFINLHGELLPMPPMRSYSDPARDPRPALTGIVSNQNFYSYAASPNSFAGGHPGVRVVTHPTQQKYVRVPGSPATSGDVQLRVYAYHEDPQEVVPFPAANTPCPDILSDPIEIQVYGVNLAQRVEQMSPIPAPPNSLTTAWLPPGVGGVAPYCLNLGTLTAAVTKNRATWAFAQFASAQTSVRTPINAGFQPYLTIEAMRGGVNVTPLINPGATLADVNEDYRWLKPQVLGLGEGGFNNRWLGYPAAFGAIAVPTLVGGNYQVGNTYRPEGWLMGWYMGTAYVYNGSLPVARCGYVPPEMDPEGIGYTMIRLYNTPLKTPHVGVFPAGKGLLSTFTAGNNYRLYGRDYIPTTCEAANNFTQDLSTDGAALEKNTARWRITIRRDALATPVRVRNARTGQWVDINAADPDHPSDSNDSDHWPVTVTTRIGSRVQDYRNNGDVSPGDVMDSEECYLWNNWAIGPVWNAAASTVMEVIDRALYPGAMRPDPILDPLVGPTAFTYTGGLRVPIPAGIEIRNMGLGVQQPLTGAPAGGWPATHRPENLSTTYFWWSDRTQDVPASEQAQFIGESPPLPLRRLQGRQLPPRLQLVLRQLPQRHGRQPGRPLARFRRGRDPQHQRGHLRRVDGPERAGRPAHDADPARVPGRGEHALDDPHRVLLLLHGHRQRNRLRRSERVCPVHPRERQALGRRGRHVGLRAEHHQRRPRRDGGRAGREGRPQQLHHRVAEEHGGSPRRPVLLVERLLAGRDVPRRLLRHLRLGGEPAFGQRRHRLQPGPKDHGPEEQRELLHPAHRPSLRDPLRRRELPAAAPGGGVHLLLQHRGRGLHLPPLLPGVHPGAGPVDRGGRQRDGTGGRVQLPPADADQGQPPLRHRPQRGGRGALGVRLRRVLRRQPLRGLPDAPPLPPQLQRPNRIGAHRQPGHHDPGPGRLHPRQRDRPGDGVRLGLHLPLLDGLPHPHLPRGGLRPRPPRPGQRDHRLQPDRPAAAGLRREPDHPHRTGQPRHGPRPLARRVEAVGRPAVHGAVLPPRLRGERGDPQLRADVVLGQRDHLDLDGGQHHGHHPRGAAGDPRPHLERRLRRGRRDLRLGHAGGHVPRASYLVRIDCYRGTNWLHYSFHQDKIYIDR